MRPIVELEITLEVAGIPIIMVILEALGTILVVGGNQIPMAVCVEQETTSVAAGSPMEMVAIAAQGITLEAVGNRMTKSFNLRGPYKKH